MLRLALLSCALPGFPAEGEEEPNVKAEPDPKETGCTITAAACKNFPEFARKQFRDNVGEQNLGTADNDAACLKRAEDFHHWCGNGAAEGAQVAATHNPSKTSQVYHPSACPPGWSQWDAFCYKHYWEKKTWYEAERLCRERDSHLASIHSRAENRFIYTLTFGLSAWIGYTDLDQDTHFQWSDSTQDDFSNFAKNCTGREDEPDCKPEEKAQQWYDWEGHDEGTFVCKRNILVPVGILHNTSAKILIEKRWDSLLPVLAIDKEKATDENVTAPILTAPEIKTPEFPPVSDGKPGDATGGAKAPEPKLNLPKGMLKI